MPGRVLTALELRARDGLDAARGRRDPRVPPRRMQFVGEGDFVATGDEFLRHFVELGGLKPHERVLDAGCGIGRMARPLAGYLNEAGSYAGFDVNPIGIGFCQTAYAADPRFSFTLVDLYHARYHPTGREKAAEFRFPYDDASFDFVVLTSVLTHLLEEEAAHYLAEVARVLAPGGRVLATFFVLDGGSRAAIASGRARITFMDADDEVAVVSDEVPEDAVAYDERWVRAHAAVRAIHPGSWRGAEAEPARSFQDLVLA